MKENKWLLRIAVIEALLVAIIAFAAVWERPAHAQLAGSTGFNFTAITTATNTQIRNVQTTLHTIVITQPGATANSITIVDTSASNCSGGVTIATIPTADLPAAMVPATLSFDIQTVNGLCVTTAGTTSPQLVVSWR